LDRVTVRRSWRDGEDFVIVEIVLRFLVKNVSRVACYKWALEASLRGDSLDEFIRTQATFQALTSDMGVRIDSTILPTKQAEEIMSIGFRVSRKESLAKQLQDHWPKITVVYYTISENHISAERETKIDSIPMQPLLLDQMQAALNSTSAGFTA
jgi:hypothetical protein